LALALDSTKCPCLDGLEFGIGNQLQCQTGIRYTCFPSPAIQSSDPPYWGGIGDAHIRDRARAPPCPATPSSASGAPFFLCIRRPFFLRMCEQLWRRIHARGRAPLWPRSSFPDASLCVCTPSSTPPSPHAPQARRLPLRVRPKPDASAGPAPALLFPSSAFLFPRLRRSLLLPLQLQEGSGSAVEMGREDGSILCTSKQ